MSPVGNAAIQEALAGKVYYNCHVAVVLTNNYFTKAAKELGMKSGVVLWDRETLLNLRNASKNKDYSIWSDENNNIWDY